MRRIYNETEIAAPVERVWELLTDFASYSSWNPFIVQARGRARPGGDLEIWVLAPGPKPTHLKCRLIAYWELSELRWVSTIGSAALLQLEHGHELRQLGPNRTLYVHWETFRGALVPMARKRIEAAEVGHRRMNAALKEEAEMRTLPPRERPRMVAPA